MNPKSHPKSHPKTPETYRNYLDGLAKDEEELEILRWLASIEETNPANIQAILDNCRADPCCKLYFVKRANGSLT